MGAADITFVRSQLSDGTLPAEAQGCDAILITAATRIERSSSDWQRS